MVSILAFGPSCPGLGSKHPPKKISEKKIVYVLDVIERRFLAESGQWLKNVDQIRLLLSSGELVLQKIIKAS